MIVPPYFDEAVRRATAVADDDLLSEDIEHVTGAWLGPWCRPLCNDGMMLLFGARSGFEALLASLANQATRIVVVERSGALRSRIAKLLGDSAEIYPDPIQALETGLPNEIAFARIDIGTFDLEALRALFGGHRVAHICGEATAALVDPLTLYRLCRSRADSFFFQFSDLGHSIAGNVSAVPIEVSVVVPAYGVAAVLPQCLDSLVRQTIRKLEVIVVDDGSHDASGQIADEYAERYPDRFRVIHKVNGGCASARMAGLKSARGEFVGFVDGDDWVEPEMYEELYRVCALRGCDLAQCGFCECFEDGTHGISGIVEDPRRLSPMQPAIWRRIYRREFLEREKIEFPTHIRRFDDLPFEFNVMERAMRIGLLPDCYYAYRQGRPGQDVEARDERLFAHFDIFEYLKNELRGDLRSERKFREVQHHTHRWALQRIHPHLRIPYFGRMVRQAGFRRALRTALLMWA
jgi:glycosyltransferase involved in cell wall biosynthesis